MRRLALFMIIIALATAYAYAGTLEYFRVYKPKDGMSAEEIMRIKYFNKYTLFVGDVAYTGKAYFVARSGATRERATARKRINLGRESDGIAYKDITVFTGPTQVKGLGILTWTYLDPQRQQEAWIWLPSLKKIRKISASEADDSFMGSDFTVEDITIRRFEDETYRLLREENFSGYASEFMKKSYYVNEPCYVIEATPKRANWYYAKRIIWIDKKHGTNIYEEKYDAKGQRFQTILRWHKVYNVNGNECPIQVFLEGRDFRTGHLTAITNDTVDINTGLAEGEFTEMALSRSRW